MKRLCLALGLLASYCLSGPTTPSYAADPADELGERFPFSDQLRVLAEDVASPEYQKLVDEMLITDLQAEWQRVATDDNADRFLEKHGGREAVMADPALRRAHQQRVEVRQRFLEIMRAGFRRYNRPAPFDEGAVAEPAGTVSAGRDRQAARLSIVYPAPRAEKHWPRFRGPDGQGNARTTGLPTTWSTTQNVVWKTAIQGSGNSSPVIWGDHIFLTSSGDEGNDRSLHCLRRTDGRLLWTRRVPDHQVEPNVRDKNGFASATPVTDGTRVIAFFGSGGIGCWDFAGSPLWHHPLPGFNTTWGTGASPLIYDDLVILIHDQNKADSFALALDIATGREVWRQARPRAMGWSTPIVVRSGDRDELIYAGGETVSAYDPRSGEQLWTLAGPTREVIPTIVAGTDLIYSASGRQGPTLAIRPGGHGDVTDSHLVWRTVRGGPHVPSPVLYDGRLYTVNDTGIATCLDASSGELLWQARIRDKFSASPLECEGLLYCCGESGVTYVLRAGDRLEIVAENDLGAPILASPAALDGRLYIRTAEALYCLARQ